ncbi:hypothetical protein A0H81_13232 [Grifola frondosa]|uniref:Uncharacterized protein n=1 Tax=Grifola frondosa TaxID=5627 RepID=A0A1C7LVR1_GRIFR|nr:hypothetical protein A0H81_13232 [Grifola frondosa]
MKQQPNSPLCNVERTGGHPSSRTCRGDPHPGRAIDAGLHSDVNYEDRELVIEDDTHFYRNAIPRCAALTSSLCKL